jgi:hypothetical protein
MTRHAGSPLNHTLNSELVQDYRCVHESSLLTHLSQSQWFHPAAASDSGQRVANWTNEQHKGTSRQRRQYTNRALQKRVQFHDYTPASQRKAFPSSRPPSTN